MAAYDDRPISVYDNLNMPASTPKSKAQTTTTTSMTASPTSTNGAASSPYNDISFRFNDNNTQQQQMQQQKQPQQTQLLPSSNLSLISTLSQLHPTTMSSNPNNYTYAIPFKPAITTTLKNTTPIQSPSSSTTTTTTTPLTSTAAITNTTAFTNAGPALRPLSQHSQSDLNEATSQSIAAVKAALNDAKSKFFGLNGYAHNETQCNNNQTFESSKNQQHTPLLFNPNDAKYSTGTTQKPKVQILTPPPKPQPKYQNIPENSAIFRNLTPPERPPKPTHFQGTNSNQLEPTSSSSASSSPNSHFIESFPNQDSSTKMPTFEQPTSSKNASPSRSNTTYKQIPLNDIECSTPSQAVYMGTTVPQNIKGSKIAGRHTPTRNSLRHSRMLVITNKNYQGIDHPNPMNFKYPNFARWLLILQIFIGSLLACLSIWIFFLAPNTAIQDNPYWSGLVLLLSGILGLSLIRFRRIKRQKVRENCFLFFRADSYVLSLAAVLLCCVAMIFATIHFARLWASDTICESSNILLEQASCLCTFNTPPEVLEAAPKNLTFDNERAVWLSNGEQFVTDFEDHSYKVEYRDLSCKEVTCEWTTILGFSMSLNGLGLLVSFIYIVLLACHRYDSKRLYTSVQTSTF